MNGTRKFGTSLLAIVWVVSTCWLFSGCQPPPAQSQQPLTTKSPNADEIEKLATASDGKEFIASPPTAVYEWMVNDWREEQLNNFRLALLKDQAKDQKENGQLTDAAYQERIKELTQMSRSEIRKAWRNSNKTTE
jgi:hypothetical protein